MGKTTQLRVALRESSARVGVEVHAHIASRLPAAQSRPAVRVCLALV